MQKVINFFDFTWNNVKHKFWVAFYMLKIALPLVSRAFTHDFSKFRPSEFRGFIQVIHKLNKVEYGSDEYRSNLRKIKPSIKKHYQINSHHPEFYDGDVSRMSLIDYIEMICDWKASNKRHKNGSLDKSIEINMERFNLDQYDMHLISKIRRIIEK